MKGADRGNGFLPRVRFFENIKRTHQVSLLRFFADRAAKKWPLRGSLKLG